MTIKSICRFGIAALFFSAAISCSSDDGQAKNDVKDNFDRQALLTFMADEFIVPAFTDYRAATEAFQNDVTVFKNAPTLANLNALKSSFSRAYLAWQDVNIFDVGPAEARTLGNFTNIYPCDTSDLHDAIANPGQNLELPSTYDIQGWPAVDYLLYGLASDPSDLVQMYLNDGSYGDYLEKITIRLSDLTRATQEEWVNSYRDEFISNNGYSATSSFNKLANDFVFHYEKELRAGKIGIPAGVFSGSALANRVEAFYSDSLSKILFLKGLEMHRRVFTGVSWDGNRTGPGLADYLDELQVRRDGDLLSTKILNQWSLVEAKAEGLDASFAGQVDNDKFAMLQLYDELQVVVAWIKVDMLQAFNVNVDYIDADGD